MGWTDTYGQVITGRAAVCGCRYGVDCSVKWLITFLLRPQHSSSHLVECSVLKCSLWSRFNFHGEKRKCFICLLSPAGRAWGGASPPTVTNPSLPHGGADRSPDWPPKLLLELEIRILALQSAVTNVRNISTLQKILNIVSQEHFSENWMLARK